MTGLIASGTPRPLGQMTGLAPVRGRAGKMVGDE